MAFKRPAASIASARSSMPAEHASKRIGRKGKTVGKNAVKKRKAVAKLSATKRNALVAAVAGMKGVPPCVRKLLSSLRHMKFSANDHEEAIFVLAGILRAKDKHLQQSVCELQDEVDGAERDKDARIEAHATAKTNASKANQAVDEAKAVLDAACNDIDAAKAAVAEGKTGRKREGVQLGMTIRKKERLECTKEQVFAPLKENMAKGIQGQKKLKELRKVGKEFGFHQVLLDSMPAVLRKQPERRQTFDSLALRSFSAEFSKTLEKMQVAAQENEMAVAGHLEAEQAAHKDLSAAKETRSQTTKNLSKAVAALAQAQKDVALSKQRVENFQKDSKATLRRLNLAKVQLSAFRTGPLAAIDELQSLEQTLAAAAEGPRAIGEKPDTIEEAIEQKPDTIEEAADAFSAGEEAMTPERVQMPSYEAKLSEVSTVVT